MIKLASFRGSPEREMHNFNFVFRSGGAWERAMIKLVSFPDRTFRARRKYSLGTCMRLHESMQCMVLRMRIHVHFEFGGTFVCAADRRSLGAYVERRESTLSTRKQIGASRENGHWWRGRRYAKRREERHRERRRMEQVR